MIYSFGCKEEADFFHNLAEKFNCIIFDTVLMLQKVKLAVVLVVIAVVVVGAFSYYELSKNHGTTTPSQTVLPYGQFYEISNTDIGSPNQVSVYEQSWIGCPVGAAASWSIYSALSNYGTLQYTNHTSDPNEVSAPSVPGLLFGNFTPGISSATHSAYNITFHVAYLYNEYLNATPAGAPISQSNLISTGMHELNTTFPAAIANAFIKYEVGPNVVLSGYNNPPALTVSPPHLNFGLLITGPGGTFIVTSPLVNKTYFNSYSGNTSYVWSHLSSFSEVTNETSYISQIITDASTSGGVSCLVSVSAYTIMSTVSRQFP